MKEYNINFKVSIASNKPLNEDWLAEEIISSLSRGDVEVVISPVIPVDPDKRAVQFGRWLMKNFIPVDGAIDLWKAKDESGNADFSTTHSLYIRFIREISVSEKQTS